MKISATIITLNEERNIERCILSLLPVVDEILVLDAFSKDNTVAIAEKLGAKVVQKEWLGYAASKNYINDLATGDYIFSMDADEALDADLQKAVLAIKNQTTIQVYSVNRLTNYCGKWIYHGGWYPDIKTRIFPKIGTKWIGEYVHEELSFEHNFPIIQLDGHLEHYSYYSFEDHRARADKYSTLTATKHFNAGKRATIFKPILSGIIRFLSMYLFKKGFLDGRMGFKIAWISAQSNIFKYNELRRLQREQKK